MKELAKIRTQWGGKKQTTGYESKKNVWKLLSAPALTRSVARMPVWA